MASLDPSRRRNHRWVRLFPSPQTRRKPELSFWSSHFGSGPHRRPFATSLFRLFAFASRHQLSVQGTMQFGLQSALSGMLHWCPRGECRIVRQAVTLIHLERAVRLSRKRSERSRQSITRRLIHLLIRRNTRKYRMCILQRRRTCELPYRLGPVYRDAQSGASFWAARWAPQRLSDVLPIGAHGLGKMTVRSIETRCSWREKCMVT
jgi:hypothetical protein